MKLLTFHTAVDTRSRFGVLLSGSRVLDVAALGPALPTTLQGRQLGRAVSRPLRTGVREP